MKSFGQELFNDGHVVEQRGGGQAAFLQQVALELGDDPGLGGVWDRWLVLHNAYLTKHGDCFSHRLKSAITTICSLIEWRP